MSMPDNSAFANGVEMTTYERETREKHLRANEARGSSHDTVPPITESHIIRAID